MKRTVLGIVMGLGLCYGQETEPRQKTLSVCEVLQQRVELADGFRPSAARMKLPPYSGSSPYEGRSKRAATAST
jgi:hypothetical protein